MKKLARMKMAMKASVSGKLEPKRRALSSPRTKASSNLFILTLRPYSSFPLINNRLSVVSLSVTAI